MKPQSSEAGQPTANRPNTDWQRVGELELPFGVDARAMISAWLPEVLAPLHLPMGFLNRVLKSAEEAAARAMRTETVMKYQHTHLLIHIPVSRPANVQTWGFFRIDKVEPAADNKNSRDHSIEFYLYLERQ